MSQKRLLSLRKVTKGNATHVKIELYYNIGGMNYFTGVCEERGLYVSVSPVSRASFGNNGGITESFTAFSGVKQCVKELNRFNQKSFDSFEVDEDIVFRLLCHVVVKNNLEIEPLAKVD